LKEDRKLDIGTDVIRSQHQGQTLTESFKFFTIDASKDAVVLRPRWISRYLQLERLDEMMRHCGRFDAPMFVVALHPTLIIKGVHLEIVHCQHSRDERNTTNRTKILYFHILSTLTAEYLFKVLFLSPIVGLRAPGLKAFDIPCASKRERLFQFRIFGWC
jgi:hypothetical protein